MVEVEIRDVEAQPIAAVRRRVTSATLASAIRNSGVWDWMRAHGVKSGGHNICVYHSEGGPEFLAEIGADVLAPIEGDGTVVASTTPAGRAVTAQHRGSYATMGATHGAITGYIAEHRLRSAGISWEIYGHWTEDESQLTTDIYYLLAPEEARQKGE